MSLSEFFQRHQREIFQATAEHIWLVGVTMLIAVAIGVPLGVLVTRRPWLSKPILGGANIAMLAGVRVATVLTIGIATIAAAVGSGGLGEFIFRGLAMVNNQLILVGAIPAAVLALAADYLLGMLEKRVRPPR